MDEQNKSILDQKSSRRSFLKKSGIAVGGLLVGGSVGSIFTKRQGAVDEAPPPSTTGETHVDFSESLQFFRRKTDFNAISSAMDIIYPKDENGPGAVELGAPYYLDKQLAGPWGINSDDYRKAPFQPGEVSISNADIFLLGARKLNEVAKADYDESGFFSLDEDKRIAILQKFEAGEVELAGVPSPVFFTMLRAATLQGCFCDPLYGGNKNMAGWIMKKFPGAQMTYLQYVEEEQFLEIPPVSVGGHTHT